MKLQFGSDVVYIPNTLLGFLEIIHCSLLYVRKLTLIDNQSKSALTLDNHNGD